MRSGLVEVIATADILGTIICDGVVSPGSPTVAQSLALNTTFHSQSWIEALVNIPASYNTSHLGQAVRNEVDTSRLLHQPV